MCLSSHFDGMPAGVAKGVPAGVAEGVPAGVAEGVPAGVADNVPLGVPEGVPAGVDGAAVGRVGAVVGEGGPGGQEHHLVSGMGQRAVRLPQPQCSPDHCSCTFGVPLVPAANSRLR